MPQVHTCVKAPPRCVCGATALDGQRTCSGCAPAVPVYRPGEATPPGARFSPPTCPTTAIRPPARGDTQPFADDRTRLMWSVEVDGLRLLCAAAGDIEELSQEEGAAGALSAA